MKKSLLALLISSVFVISACEDKAMTQKVINAEKNIVQLETQLKNVQSALEAKENELAQLSVVKAENEQLKAELEKAQQNVGLRVEIIKLFEKKDIIKHKVDPKEEYMPEESRIESFVTIPKTNLEWLNNLLIKVAYDPDDNLGRKLQNPTEAEFKQYLAEMYQGLADSVKEEPVIGYEESIYSDFLGQRNHIASFSIQHYSYAGGAHGMHHTHYINVDLNKKSEISLKDLVNQKKQSEFKEALWESYAMSRVDENGKYNGFGDKKEFRISPDFYFSSGGIVFVYPPYELGPYAEGDVEVLLPWYQANDLLNPDYQRGEKDGFFKQEEK